MAQRIKGQNVVVQVMKDGALQARLDSFQSLSIEFELEQIEEGYLGEPANRYDSTFKGCKLSIEGHMSSRQALDFTNSVVERAKQRAGGPSRIDVIGSFAFPNGDFVNVVLIDVFFESIPIEAGGKDDYVKVSYEGRSSDYRYM